ncbi:MAG: NACHT domain-containing protein [Acidobacteriota bacterium]|nr:NACHT domain-containing protein [Acidobacteriota bacterium]
MSRVEAGATVESKEVREQLARMLQSDIFARAELLSRFLKVVVTERLAGNTPKASFLLEEVFNDRERRSRSSKASVKGADDETKVRVEAVRLRQKLLEYYSGPGAEDPVLIEIPKGRYLATFRLRNPEPLPGTEPEAVERRRMIQRVRNDWIRGVLEHSLYKRARIDLRLNFEPRAVANPRLLLQRLDEEVEDLPPGTRLLTVFEESGGGLLILGSPGAGKTTLLLELARDLLHKAEREVDFHIPVIFNLSSWKPQKAGLETWLIQQLNDRYDVPRNTAERWVTAEQVLPLLDGLDEVLSEHRHACLEAINTYRARHGLLSLVVASRSADYEVLQVRLRLPMAVFVQPLTYEEVRRFLSEPIPAFKRLLGMIETDVQLAEVLQSPLMLSIAILVYETEDLPEHETAQTAEERRTRLLSRYVELMLHKRREQKYSSRNTRKWLVWLATEMQRRSEAVFYLESLGPKWVGQPGRALIPVLTVLGASSLAFSTYCLLMLMPYCLSTLTSSRFADLPLIAMKFGALPVPLLSLGLIVHLLRRRTDLAPAERVRWRTTRMGSVMRSFSTYRYALWTSLMIQVFFFALVSIPWVRSITPEKVRAVNHNAYSPLWNELWILTGGIGAGIFITFVESSLRVQQPIRVIPNGGTHRSARNALLVGVLTAVPIGVLYGTTAYLAEIALGTPRWIAFGTAVLTCAISGFWIGSIIGLLRGGLFSIQHLFTRLMLWVSGNAPLRYVRFLNSAVDIVFLRRVGGGYSFIHRIVLEYFVSLGTD